MTDSTQVFRRSFDAGFECDCPERGWQPLEVYHGGRPDWAPTIIREIAEKKLGRS